LRLYDDDKKMDELVSQSKKTENQPENIFPVVLGIIILSSAALRHRLRVQTKYDSKIVEIDRSTAFSPD